MMSGNDLAREDVRPPLAPGIVAPETAEEWELELRTFSAANDPDSTEETRQLVRDLWAAFCGRDALFTERDGLRERIEALGDPKGDMISRAEVLALLGGEAPVQKGPQG